MKEQYNYLHALIQSGTATSTAGSSLRPSGCQPLPSIGLIERSNPSNRIEEEPGCAKKYIVRRLPCTLCVEQLSRKTNGHARLSSQWPHFASLYFGERMICAILMTYPQPQLTTSNVICLRILSIASLFMRLPITASDFLSIAEVARTKNSCCSHFRTAVAGANSFERDTRRIEIFSE